MKKLYIIFFLFFSCVVDLNGMTESKTVQKQHPSSLPKVLHKIAYSENVGKFCSWLFKPISECCKSERLRSWFKKPLLEAEDPIVTFTKVTPSTSSRVGRVKKSLALISIGFLLLCNLPQAGAFINNLQDFAKPKICLENDTMQRCCTIEDNVHISCCTTDKLMGITVCKDFLMEMPETASIPFQDLSRMKDQCSADLTDETRAIRQELDDNVLPKWGPPSQRVREIYESAGLVPPETCVKNCDSYFLIRHPIKGRLISFEPFMPHFLKKFQKSLDAIGLDPYMAIIFKPSQQSSHFLEARIVPEFSGTTTRPEFRAWLELSHNELQLSSVDEIFSSINHELGHIVFRLRKFAQLPPSYELQLSQSDKFEQYAEEIFADLVSTLLSEPNTNQIGYLRQHIVFQEPNSPFKPQKDSMSCIPDGTRSHPPMVCRVAYANNIQDQLEDIL